MKRTFALCYSVISYTLFLGTFLYAAGFLINVAVPKSIDSIREHSSLLGAASGNAFLLLLFAVQHSVMARPKFKAWWTKFVAPPIERSTYVLFSSLALIALFWFWEPIGIIIWDVENPAAKALLYGLFLSGFLIVLITTFLINHFDLFGLRQAWIYFRGQIYEPLKFVTPGPYKHVRHPLYVGWLLAFWATPHMTAAHLLFAVLTTVYILLAIRWEEKDLLDFHGKSYARYRSQVPKLIPCFNSNGGHNLAEETSLQAS